MVAVFVAGGLVAFPVVILIAATAAAFGPWFGFLYATMGVLASALATYALGAQFGQRALRNVMGPRLDRIRDNDRAAVACLPSLRSALCRSRLSLSSTSRRAPARSSLSTTWLGRCLACCQG